MYATFLEVTLAMLMRTLANMYTHGAFSTFTLTHHAGEVATVEQRGGRGVGGVSGQQIARDVPRQKPYW